MIDLAAKKAEITVIPIPLFFSAQQILHLFQDSTVDTIFMADVNLTISAYHLDCVAKKHTWLHSLSEQGRIQQLLAAEQAIVTFIRLNVAASEPTDSVVPAKITYTSGSTGTPKGVCLAEETIQSITESLSTALQTSQLGRHLCLIPFATLLENIAGIYVALNMGRSIVVGNAVS